MSFNLEILVPKLKIIIEFHPSPFLAIDRANQLSSDFHQIMLHAPDLMKLPPIDRHFDPT